MIKKICPICHRKLKTAKDSTPEDGKCLPFCSERCKLIDLGAWFDSDYAVPSKLEDNEDMETE